jgi:hypothetical protein
LHWWLQWLWTDAAAIEFGTDVIIGFVVAGCEAGRVGFGVFCCACAAATAAAVANAEESKANGIDAVFGDETADGLTRLLVGGWAGFRLRVAAAPVGVSEEGFGIWDAVSVGVVKDGGAEAEDGDAPEGCSKAAFAERDGATGAATEEAALAVEAVKTFSFAPSLSGEVDAISFGSGWFALNASAASDKDAPGATSPELDPVEVFIWDCRLSPEAAVEATWDAASSAVPAACVDEPSCGRWPSPPSSPPPRIRSVSAALVLLSEPIVFLVMTRFLATLRITGANALPSPGTTWP